MLEVLVRCPTCLLDRAMVVTPSEYSLIRQATLLEKNPKFIDQYSASHTHMIQVESKPFNHSPPWIECCESPPAAAWDFSTLKDALA